MEKSGTPNLIAIWIMYSLFLLGPVSLLLFASYAGLNYRINAAEPIMLRTIFYIVTIIAFPLINLLRHIMLRLNQTMPGSKPAHRRYLKTVLVSLIFSEGIAGLGLLLYFKGDNFDTLIIYILLALLALFLYRPKQQEYEQILDELESRRTLRD